MFFAAAFLLVLLLSASPSPSAGQRDKECDSHNDCKSSEKCVGFMGECTKNTGLRVSCQRNSQCRDRVSSRSKCDIFRKGRCERTTRLCRDEEDVWVEECRRGYRCDSNQYCARSRSAGIGGDFFDEDRRDDGFCSVARPCPIGRTCCSDGTCSRSRSCTCSRSSSSSSNRRRGVCPLGEECDQRRGECREITCSRARDCPRGFRCRSGLCREDPDFRDSVEFPDRDECSVDNRNGRGACHFCGMNLPRFCPSGHFCRGGRCVSSLSRDRKPCSRAVVNGYCPADEVCKRGRCVPDQQGSCSKKNRKGYMKRRRRRSLQGRGIATEYYYSSSSSRKGSSPASAARWLRSHTWSAQS